MTTLRLTSEWPEKRQLIRFRVVDFHASSSVVDLVLRDLNSEGMSIETRHPLRVGASYPFKIRRRRQTVPIDGVVKWCKLLRMIDIGGGDLQALYRAGIAFSRRLDDFLPGVAVDPETLHDGEPAATSETSRSASEKRSPIRCPDCRVPAVVGARRCRICGTLLPQV